MGRRKGVTIKSANRIQIEFRYKGESIRKIFKLDSAVEANLDYCETTVKRYRQEVEFGIFDYEKEFPNGNKRKQFAKLRGDVVSIGEALDQYLVSLNEDYINKEIKFTTWDDANKICAILYDVFGDRRMTDLKLVEVANWVYARRFKGEKISRSRATSLVAPLRRIYEYAAEQGHVEINILAGWKPDKKRLSKKKKRKADPFDPKEIDSILSSCKDEQLQNLFRFAFWSGLRSGELIELRWEDVNFETNIVQVQRSSTRKHIDNTKTEAGEREVQLLPEALAALKSQKQYTLLINGYVFHNPKKDEPWAEARQILRAWDDVLENAGVRRRVAYQTRHTFASMMLSSGEEELWASEQMGHADKTMIKKAYSKQIKTLNPNAGMKADAAYKAALEKG